MGIAQQPSVVTMPMMAQPYPTIFSFLCDRFPTVSPDIWRLRIAAGNVLDEKSHPITLDSRYAPQRRIFYFREVECEPSVPFAEKILYCDDDLLVACKPHFLPVTPGGRFVTECLLNRLKLSTGLKDLTPLHRIDRETAGIVLFSVNRRTRGEYGRLFLEQKIEKTYQAVSRHHPARQAVSWDIENRIVRGEPWFRMKTVDGRINARSSIRLSEVRGDRALFTLRPLTGKTHQLRVHMSGIGYGILNDRYYPLLQDERDDDVTAPLQLIAKHLRFTDPLTGAVREFQSERRLQWENSGPDM